MPSASFTSRLATARFYAIVDTGYVAPERILAVTRDLVAGGVDLIQLRAKKLAPERIAELGRLRAGLTRCIGCGCLSLQDCQFANPGDRASRLGPGPRYWIGDKRL